MGKAIHNSNVHKSLGILPLDAIAILGLQKSKTLG